MSKAVRITFIILSVLSLLNVLFVPMYDEGGGMLTAEAEYNFVRVIGDAIMTEGGLRLWVMHMTVGVFIPSVIMLACALTRIRWIYGTANTAGVLIWFFNFFRYALKHGFIYLFDIYKTDISVGSWIAILLFLISALVLLFTKKKKKEETEEEEEEEEKEMNFCPHCGIKLRGNTSYCRRCGKKL